MGGVQFYGQGHVARCTCWFAITALRAHAFRSHALIEGLWAPRNCALHTNVKGLAFAQFVPNT